LSLFSENWPTCLNLQVDFFIQGLPLMVTIYNNG
jgi:hypothetical protein